MLKNIAIFFTGIFALIIILGLTLPNDYEISRSVTIDASTGKVHSYLNDLEQWPKWAPWQSAEQDVNIKLGDISTGAGASQTWTGQGGSGSLKITQASPQNGIEYILRFGEDGDDTNGRFEYAASGAQTTVTWTMAGEMTMPVIGPYAVFIMDMMAGPTFDLGLNKLKSVVEGKAVEQVAVESP